MAVKKSIILTVRLINIVSSEYESNNVIERRGEALHIDLPVLIMIMMAERLPSL